MMRLKFAMYVVIEQTIYNRIISTRGSFDTFAFRATASYKSTMCNVQYAILFVYVRVASA